jgi:succinate dehydrogenase/fumarate reductase flavoprotein subunit
VLFNTPVVQLVTEGEKVVGAIVKGENGYVKYLTAKGVVLATGGYEFNPEKLAACCRPRDLALGHWMNGTKTNTGDGHEMAKAIGAMEDEYPHPLMLDPEQLMPYLRVNKRGVRFTAEYEAYNHLANAIQAQPGAYNYYIVDANVMDIVTSIWTPSSSCYGPKEVWAGAATSDKALKADTLEELAEKMGVPVDAFVATINHWNEMCDAGEDTDFHFPGKMMHKIDTAPFYATKEMASALCTCGGLQITAKSEVLNTEAQPIEGLYAIGNVSGSMFSGTYPHNENCLSHSRCVTFGYNVAKTLAAL